MLLSVNRKALPGSNTHITRNNNKKPPSSNNETARQVTYGEKEW